VSQAVERWTSQSIGTMIIPFRSRTILIEGARIALLACSIALTSLIIAMWLDVIWSMPESVRWVFTRIGSICVFTGASFVYYRKVRRATISSLAIYIDDKAKTGGQVLVGLELEREARFGTSTITRGLAALAANQASSQLANISPDAVLPLQLARRPLVAFTCILSLIVLLSLVMPSLAWNQFQRFLFPSRDVPPYTGVVIEIEPMEAAVRYGEDFTVKAFVKSGNVDRMQLITIVNGKERIVPMLPEKERSWQAILIRVSEPMDLFARSGASRSSIGHLKVLMTPKIESVRVRVTPPEYTHRAVFDGPIPNEGILGLAGTQVEWIAQSNRPLSSGQINLQLEKSGTQSIVLSPRMASNETALAESREVHGSFELTESGSFSLNISDVDGTKSIDRVEGKITIATDQRPVVRILEPRPLSLATPDINLPVVVAAEDDFGISSLQVFRSLNDSISEPMSLSVDGGPRQNQRFELPLPKYGLEPGDEIRLFARAEDNDPKGAKGTESPVTVIQIISIQEFQEMMLEREGAESMQAKYNAAERHLENFADAVRQAAEAAKQAEANPDSAKANQELQAKLQQAQKVAAEATKAMNEMSKQAMPIDVDQSLAKELKEMADKTAEHAEQLQQMAQDQAGERPLTEEESKELSVMAQDNQDNRNDLKDKAIEPLDAMQAALPLMMAEDSFKQLVEQQRELAERMEGLKSASDPHDIKTQRRAAELEAEQDQIRQNLDQLLDRIESQSQQLDDSPDLSELKSSAQEFAQAVRDSKAMKKMADAQQGILSNNFNQAQQSADQAADELERFLKQCNGMSQAGEKACKLKFSPSRGGPGLGNSIKQMRQMLGKGKKKGSSRGFGKGNESSGGYAQRFPGPQNVGMYGAMPTPPQQSQRGHSDKVSKGTATVGSTSNINRGAGQQDTQTEGAGGGQSDARIPSQYRNQVQEYFRRISEQLGDKP